MPPTDAANPTSPTSLATLEQVHQDVSDLFEQVSDPDGDRPAALQRLIRRMAAHASAEKQHLVPAVEGADGGADVAARLAQDNADMEKVLGLVERRSVTSPDLVDLLNDLLATFEAHVGHFREEVAPLLRDGGVLAGDAELAERLGTDVASEDAHPPLLPDSGPLGRAGRAVASALDAARNRTVDR